MATRTIRRVAPLSLGKVMAVVYGLLGCIFIPFAWMGVFFSGEGRSFLVAILFPLLYAVVGLIGGLLTAVFYNLAGGWVGGIQVVLDE